MASYEVKGIRSSEGTLWELGGVTFLTRRSVSGQCCVDCDLHSSNRCNEVYCGEFEYVHIPDRDIEKLVKWDALQYINEDGDTIITAK